MIIVKKKNIGYDNTKRFVFIISSYNSCKFIKRNLNSIKMQKYNKNKYRIIYVNDNSNDDSKNILLKFMSENKTINMDLINNKENMGPAYSRYIAYNKANDHEICIFLDGDDWLVEKETLKILSHVYKNNNIYSTFGSNFPNGRVCGEARYKNIKRETENSFFPHLRTAYAFLCKNIPKKYLKYNNEEWLKVKTDVALFISTIELCNNKYAVIKHKLMHYNMYNSINNTNTGFRNFKINPNKQKSMREKYKKYISNLKKLKPIIDKYSLTPLVSSDTASPGEKSTH
jgi:glycosyltransferase involved in cell wall biosynthesis